MAPANSRRKKRRGDRPRSPALVKPRKQRAIEGDRPYFFVWGVIAMSDLRKREIDEERPPEEKEEQDSLLARLISLAPLFYVMLYLLEIILRLTGVIK
jgi:hypothetical protein